MNDPAPAAGATLGGRARALATDRRVGLALGVAVPLYLVDGTAELAGRRDLALEWFAMVDAPIKRILTVEGAAHAPALEQYEEFHRFLVETVVPETYGRD